jgi:hypothetical protein
VSDWYIAPLVRTKYMDMSRDRNAGRYDGVNIDNRSIERV